MKYNSGLIFPLDIYMYHPPNNEKFCILIYQSFLAVYLLPFVHQKKHNILKCHCVKNMVPPYKIFYISCNLDYSFPMIVLHKWIPYATQNCYFSSKYMSTIVKCTMQIITRIYKFLVFLHPISKQSSILLNR